MPVESQKELHALLEISGKTCYSAVYYSDLSYKSIWAGDKGRKNSTGENVYNSVY